jgi:hypothetical protein
MGRVRPDSNASRSFATSFGICDASVAGVIVSVCIDIGTPLRFGQT